MSFNMASYNRLPQGNYDNSQVPNSMPVNQASQATTGGGQGFTKALNQYNGNTGQLGTGQNAANPNGVNTAVTSSKDGAGKAGMISAFTALGDKLHNNTMRSIQLFTGLDRQREQDKIAEKDRLLNIQQNNLNNQRQGRLLDANLAQQNAGLKDTNLNRQMKDYQFRQAIKQGNAGADIGRWVALGMVGGLKEVGGN